jgi:aspartate racemase
MKTLIKQTFNPFFSKYERNLQKARELTFPYPTIGIIGGMGPDATGDLFNAITRITRELTGGKKDQDYLPIHIASSPQIPDRTKYVLYLLGKSDEFAEDPFPYLLRGYLDLKHSSRDKQRIKYVGIPCNNAHYFVPKLREFIEYDGSEMEIVDMIEETVKMISKQYPYVQRVGVLATNGTLQTELYHNVLESAGFKTITPTPEDQKELVTEAIFGCTSGKGIKAGYFKEPNEKLREAVEKLRIQGAEVIIAGCTEIPLVLHQEDVKAILVNPTEILARRLVELTLDAKNS